jgi:hypothetical protein
MTRMHDSVCRSSCFAARAQKNGTRWEGGTRSMLYYTVLGYAMNSSYMACTREKYRGYSWTSGDICNYAKSAGQM